MDKNKTLYIFDGKQVNIYNNQGNEYVNTWSQDQD